MSKINRPCCDECGGLFISERWMVEHRLWCSQNPNKRTPQNKAIDNRDQKGVFLANWKIVYPNLWRTKKFIPIYEPEHQFALKSIGRNWAFDYAWPDYKIAVEIDGGNRLVKISPKTGKPVAVGRHTQETDYEKLNYAALLGWYVFRFTPNMIVSDPVRWCGVVYDRLVKSEFEKDHQIIE